MAKAICPADMNGLPPASTEFNTFITIVIITMFLLTEFATTQLWKTHIYQKINMGKLGSVLELKLGKRDRNE